MVGEVVFSLYMYSSFRLLIWFWDFDLPFFGKSYNTGIRVFDFQHLQPSHPPKKKIKKLQSISLGSHGTATWFNFCLWLDFGICTVLRAICGSPADGRAQWWGSQRIDKIKSKKSPLGPSGRNDESLAQQIYTWVLKRQASSKKPGKKEIASHGQSMS